MQNYLKWILAKKGTEAVRAGLAERLKEIDAKSIPQKKEYLEKLNEKVIELNKQLAASPQKLFEETFAWDLFLAITDAWAIANTEYSQAIRRFVQTGDIKELEQQPLPSEPPDLK
jgi:hypothetical protein